MALVIPVIGILFEVLLTFSLLKTNPAEPLPALRALHLGAATADHRNRHSALLIWTRFSTLLEVNLIKSSF